MKTALKDINWGFDGAGSIGGVFSGLSLSYPATATVVGHFVLEERILTKTNQAIPIGDGNRTIPFSYNYRDFGFDPGAPEAQVMIPLRNLNTGALIPGQVMPLSVLMTGIYSLQRMRVQEEIDRENPPVIEEPAP